mgnify:FL=1
MATTTKIKAAETKINRNPKTTKTTKETIKKTKIKTKAKTKKTTKAMETKKTIKMNRQSQVVPTNNVSTIF